MFHNGRGNILYISYIHTCILCPSTWLRQHFIFEISSCVLHSPTNTTSCVTSIPPKHNICWWISWSSFLCLARWWEPFSPWADSFSCLVSAYSEYSPPTPTNLLHHHTTNTTVIFLLLLLNWFLCQPFFCGFTSQDQIPLSPHRLGSVQPPDRETSHRWRSPTAEYLQMIMSMRRGGDVEQVTVRNLWLLRKKMKQVRLALPFSYSPNAHTSDLVVNLL